MGKKVFAVVILVAGVWGVVTYSLSRDRSPAAASPGPEEDASEAEAVAAPSAATNPKAPAPVKAQARAPEPEEDQDEPVLIAQRAPKPVRPRLEGDVSAPAMQQHWERGDPDPEWQAEAAGFLDAELQRLALDAQGKDVSCRGPLCRAVLKFRDTATAQKLYGVRQVEGVQSVASSKSDGKGGIEVTIFSTRQGVTLQDVAGDEE